MTTVHEAFLQRARHVLFSNPDVTALAVAGSYLTDEIDEYSDLDLIVVTNTKISEDKRKMLSIVASLGNFLSGFTGEHVGEPRVLICLYDEPLLHVDIKFLTADEFQQRIETPVILFDKEGHVKRALETSTAKFPFPDYQWIEDRFWIWVHYALLKIGRGEYLEAFDFLGYIRMVVLGPLLQIRNGNLPRGVRKVETDLPKEEFEKLKATVAVYERKSLLESLQQAVTLYRDLRDAVYSTEILRQQETEERVMAYFGNIREQTPV